MMTNSFAHQHGKKLALSAVGTKRTCAFIRGSAHLAARTETTMRIFSQWGRKAAKPGVAAGGGRE